MKTLYLIGGTMGAGKTAVCQRLKKDLPNSVFLDGDWCWDLTPFTVTQETKELVLSNAAHLLRSFLNCTAAENVLFSWVMPRREIVDELLARIGAKTQFFLFTLTARPDTVRARLEGDVAAGRRTPDVIARALARLPLYEADMGGVKIATDGMAVFGIARTIADTVRTKEMK